MKVKTCTSCKEFVRVSGSYTNSLKVNKFSQKHACHPMVILDERDLGPNYHSVDAEIDHSIIKQRKEEHIRPDYANLWFSKSEESQS